jgi:hypothetical protein
MAIRFAIAGAFSSILLGFTGPGPPASVEPFPAAPALEQGVDWPNLVKQSLFFASLQHGFRLATEADTRQSFRGPFLQGWGEAVRSVHGWADGDPFIVNYVGHPMQGAVTGYIWIQNDRAFRRYSFSRDPRYWKSRLRAAGFAALYSEQFEIGPFSEATIGKVQRDFPQRGFVDHVVTPSIGLGWMIAEDAVDRYVIEPFERRVTSPWARLLFRGGLNPARSMANLMAGRVPWYREYRPGVFVRDSFVRTRLEPSPESDPAPGVAPFEVAFAASPEALHGHPCVGGSVVPSFRLAGSWQIVTDIGGCKLLSMPQGASGDIVHYRVGSRWSPRAGRRVSPHAQFLVGGAKLSVDESGPEKRRMLDAIKRGVHVPRATRHAVLQTPAANGFSVAAGTGIDIHLSRAVALRLLSLEYQRNWLPPLAGIEYTRGLRFSSGVLLKMGTW